MYKVVWQTHSLQENEFQLSPVYQEKKGLKFYIVKL